MPQSANMLIDLSRKEHDLERTATGTEHTVDHLRLVPRPSNDPADPLNWPLWRKLAILWASSFYSFVNNWNSAAMAPAIPILAVVLQKDFAQLTHLVAVNVLMAGAANLWWVPLANAYGRRPVLLFCTLLMTFSTMWCGLAGSFNNLLAARVVQGIGIAAADAVAPDVAGEIFFVHQRGRAMAIYTIFLSLGSLVGGVTGGYIASAYGYKYIFWVGTALSAASFLFILVLQPETLYDRTIPAVADNGAHTTDKEDGRPMETKGSDHIAHLEESSSYRPFTYGRSLRVGVNRGGLPRALLRPWASLLFPGTWLVMLHYGGLVGGIVTLSTVGPTLLAMPPYLWGANVGLLNVGGIIGALLGAVYAYLTADRRITASASHDSGGHAEPETRLPLLAAPLFIATTGMWVFGFCAQYPGPTRWVGLEFGLGMLSFGLMSVPSIGFNYVCALSTESHLFSSLSSLLNP